MKYWKMQIITEDEYQNAKKVVEKVKIERNILQEKNPFQLYNAHIELPDNFGELLIDIKRKNAAIENQIKEIKNIYLKKYNYTEKARAMLEECIMLLEIKHTNSNPEIVKKISDLDCQLESFIKIMDELISKKNAHTYLYHYIETLEKEELQAQKVISLYERQHRDTFSIFRFKK